MSTGSLSTTPTAALGATRAAAVAEELRRLILSGELAPGTHLRQVELAERFNVSTTPVREALGLLARQGLVRHDVQKGVDIPKSYFYLNINDYNQVQAPG